jgi:hypothetical protein
MAARSSSINMVYLFSISHEEQSRCPALIVIWSSDLHLEMQVVFPDPP